MSNLFFTSDLHFGHANIIKYCNRPFSSAEEMDEALISNWNAVVTNADRIVILGDVFFTPEAESLSILSRLRGNKELVLGNHDKNIRKSSTLQAKFTEIHPDLLHTNFGGQLTVLCHFPLLTWDRAGRGSYMLHGHSHNTIPFDPKYRRLDVGVDGHNYTPIEWGQIKKKLDEIDPQAHFKESY
jgi:calcineurin-like phosphoesterase family protein